MGKDTDLLGKSVAFLQKRDGTDKLLKILRYSAKLALATKVISPSSPASQRLKSFESSVGISRKALRLGKFLQDVNELRRAPSFATTEGVLELISSGGEGVYYFVEQFIWLVSLERKFCTSQGYHLCSSYQAHRKRKRPSYEHAVSRLSSQILTPGNTKQFGSIQEAMSTSEASGLGSKERAADKCMVCSLCVRCVCAVLQVKAGAIDKSHGPRLQKLSALFELVGYTGSLTLKAMQVASLSSKEAAIIRHIEKLRSNSSCTAEKPSPLLTNGALDTARSTTPEGHTAQDDAQRDGTEDSARESGAETHSEDSVGGSVTSQQELILQQEAALQGVQFKRTLKLLSLIQDLSDSVLAFADVIDEDRQPRFLRNASFLAAAGLLSAVISANKNWVALG